MRRPRRPRRVGRAGAAHAQLGEAMARHPGVGVGDRAAHGSQLGGGLVPSPLRDEQLELVHAHDPGVRERLRELGAPRFERVRPGAHATEVADLPGQVDDGAVDVAAPEWVHFSGDDRQHGLVEEVESGIGVAAQDLRVRGEHEGERAERPGTVGPFHSAQLRRCRFGIVGHPRGVGRQHGGDVPQVAVLGAHRERCQESAGLRVPSGEYGASPRSAHWSPSRRAAIAASRVARRPRAGAPAPRRSRSTRACPRATTRSGIPDRRPRPRWPCGPRCARRRSGRPPSRGARRRAARVRVGSHRRPPGMRPRPLLSAPSVFPWDPDRSGRSAGAHAIAARPRDAQELVDGELFAAGLRARRLRG